MKKVVLAEKDELSRLPQFDWDKAQTLYYVAKLGSFTSAAQFLNISQSAISRKVATLEYSLKCNLFVRTSRGLELTRKGQEFFLAVEKAFLAFREFSSHQEDSLRNGKKRKIKISTTNLVAGYILDEYLFEYNENNPEILFEVVADDHLIDVIINDVDIAIRPYDSEKQELQQEYLFTLEKSLYASPAYLKKHGEPRTVEELKNHYIINYPKKNNAYPYSDLEWALKLGMENGERLVPVYTTSCMQSFFKAAEAGLGIIPSYGQLEIIKKGSFKNILPAIRAPLVEWYFVCPKYLSNDKEVKNLKDYLFERLTNFRSHVNSPETYA